MGYESPNTNDKVIAAVAIGSAVLLIGLIPMFRGYFASSVGARQAAAYAEGTTPHVMRLGADGSRSFPSEEELLQLELADDQDDSFRLVPVGDGIRTEAAADQCIASGRSSIDAAMARVASGRTGLRPQQNEQVDAVTGWNQLENTAAANAATASVQARTAREEAAAAARAAASAAAAGEEGADAPAPARNLPRAIQRRIQQRLRQQR